MPATKRPKPIYQRGDFKLYPRAGRHHEIVWYDAERKRERSITAGTSDVGAARAALDRRYLEATRGEAFCPTCGQPRQSGGVLLMAAIADYLTLSADKPSIGAIRPRLNHILSYAITTDQTAIRCDQIDEPWITRFRAWSLAQPIVAPSGAKRLRSLSTVENSVLQLAAAINAGGAGKAQFRAAQPKEVNRTPTFRADIPMIIRMFRYCLYPDARSPVETKRRCRERQHLLSFLRISVATMARPDAAHDVSTDPRRRQWQSNARVLDLNPAGRRQTRKYRATVPVARQLVPIFDAVSGPVIPTQSVENAWASMAIALELPGEGQSGMKLIRRSIAHIARQRLPEEAWGEVTLFLGHDRFDDTSDLYAPFSPTYLRRALAVIETVIDEIEAGCPGAFYRTVTADAGNVVSLGSAK